ncbi:hypothetical protein BG006_010022 [Podila minutissima]|uniref:Zn(2)-C6 fungal-type domain-containing protein n=1 Tax=Podila minutissima TaxID=64525 RepID=A0A9P5SDQ1_9FUNG|nr:hypothetical protein BG006_010022 [Podila minutissima]
MPMQVFEFQADTSVSLASPAAINRKSCDHCFLNRKTCDKVREEIDTGAKCGRCAKDSRPCTFTPTVHLYHIADCVGRHQCRAKVIQAMGGRKKEVKFKTIEIPIVCDMDSDVDVALFDFIQKQPNLLVYNNRIKSFLAQDMLGVSPDYESLPVSNQYSPMGSNYASSPVSPMGSKRSFGHEDMGVGYPQSSPQGPNKYRIMSPVEPNYAQLNNNFHQKSVSEDQGRYVVTSSAYNPTQNMAYSGSRHSLPNVHTDALTQLAIATGRTSPVGSPMTGSPNSLEASYHQRRHSETVPNMASDAYSNTYQPQPLQPIQHPYAQQAPYPQASFYQQQQQQQQQQQLYGYRTPSPIPPSPLGASSVHSNSPHPPSPLELSLNINTNFGSLSNNNSHQNLPSLFDTTLTMSSQVTSPMIKTESQGEGQIMPQSAPPPLVITTTNADGNEVGFYYAVPPVNLNPGYHDSDLFQDFAMGDDGDAVGEDFVWIENLFVETNAAEEAAAVAAAAMAGQVASVSGLSLMSNLSSNMDMSLAQQAWSSDFELDLGNDRAGRITQTLQG